GGVTPPPPPAPKWIERTEVPGWTSRMRALRDLSAAVSDVPGAGGGDGLAARANLSHARRRGRSHPAHAGNRAPSRSLPRVPRVRDRVSLGGAGRAAPREDSRRADARGGSLASDRSRHPARPPRGLPPSRAVA